MSAARSDVKTEPVGFRRIQKTIEGVLGKRFFEGTCFLLHIHTSSSENVPHLILKQRNSGNAFLFGAVALLQQPANVMLDKKLLDTIK
ncbi:MAG: hypothetical protein ACLTKE_03345 [Coprococcus sp.]